MTLLSDIGPTLVNITVYAVTPVLTGVISGIIASYLIGLKMQKRAPEILIAKEIALTPRDDDKNELRARVKFINNCNRDCHDLHIEVFFTWIRHTKDKDGKTHNLTVSQTYSQREIAYLQGRLSRIEDLNLLERCWFPKKTIEKRDAYKYDPDPTDNAMRVPIRPTSPHKERHNYTGDLAADFKSIRENHSQAQIRFQVTAQDCITGVRRTFLRDFDLDHEDALVRGEYRAGDDLAISRHAEGPYL